MIDAPDSRFTARVVVAFALLYVIWGSTYFAIRIVITSIPPAASAGLRFTVAGLIMLAVVRINGYRLVGRARELRSFAIVGCLLLVGGNGLVVWSEQYVASGVAAAVVATVPLWVAILGALLPDGERLAPTGWVGVFCGIGGLCTLLWPKLAAGLGMNLRGEGALLVASLCWATGSLYAKRATVTLSPFVATGWEMLFGGIVLLLIALGAGEFAHFSGSGASWMALAYLVVFGSCIAFSAYIWLLHNVPAAKVTTYAYVNPVIAVLLGCVFAGEPFTVSMMIGTPMIIAAVALVMRARVDAGEHVTRSEPRHQLKRTAA